LFPRVDKQNGFESPIHELFTTDSGFHLPVGRDKKLMASQNMHNPPEPIKSDVQKPLVSYVVCSYNHEYYVEKAIRSIVDQDYESIELIVVDDCSTDSSLKILDQLKQEYNFKLIKNKKNKGIVRSVNIGVSHANGKYIVFHASDDISHATRTGQQVAVLENNCDAGFVCGATRKVDHRGEVLVDWPIKMTHSYTFEDFYLRQPVIHAVACMYRTSAVKKITPLNESIPFEDLQLYWNVTRQNLVCIYDTSVQVIDYRILPSSLGRQKSKMYAGKIKFISAFESEPWYPKVLRRFKTQYLLELAKSSKTEAFQFLLLEFGNIDLRHSHKVLAAFLMPKCIIKRFFSKPY